MRYLHSLHEAERPIGLGTPGLEQKPSQSRHSVRVGVYANFSDESIAAEVVVWDNGLNPKRVGSDCRTLTVNRDVGQAGLGTWSTGEGVLVSDAVFLVLAHDHRERFGTWSPLSACSKPSLSWRGCQSGTLSGPPHHPLADIQPHLRS